MIIWGPNIALISIQLKRIWMVTIDKIHKPTYQVYQGTEMRKESQVINPFTFNRYN